MSHVSLQEFLKTEPDGTLEVYREVNHLILLKNPGGKWIKRDLMG